MPRTPRILHPLLWLVPLLLWLECSLRPVAEPDLFFYFALVERYLKFHVWPVTDPYLFTLPNDTLTTLHQWLGYWTYYLPYMAIGWAGPILLMTFFLGLFFQIPLLPFWRRRELPPLYFPLIWTLAVFSAHHRFRERVSLFGDLFTLLLTAGLFWAAKTRRFWYVLPGLFLLWAQMHPSFPLGWVILFVYLAFHWKQPRHVWICTALTLLTPFLNPLGWEGVFYPFSFAIHIEPYLTQYVVEWLPLTDKRLWEFSFLYVPFIVYVPLLLWQLWRQRREADFFEWFALALATALTLKSVRFGLMAQGLFLAMITNCELRRPLLRLSWKWTLAPILLASLAIAGVKIGLSSKLNLPWSQRFYIDTGYFPEAAVNDLERMNPHMNIFNSFGYGGYLAWRWQGNPKIFFHGFSTNFKFYEKYYNGPQESLENFNAMTEKFGIGVFLLSKIGNDASLIYILEHHNRWQRIREDGTSLIYAKRDPRVFP